MRPSTALLVVVVVAVMAPLAVHAAYCHGKPHPDAQPNMNPLITSTDYALVKR